jgi:hypothetical protein
MAPWVRGVVSLGVAAAAPLWLVWGCAPVPSDDCGAQHNCPAETGVPTDGSRPDTSGDAAPSEVLGDTSVGDAAGSESSSDSDASACDAAKSPHDDPCVVNERFGVFVSPLGADTNAGTKSAPLLTIGRGMDAAKASGKRVYVCAGSFSEQLIVGISRDGVNVYGGFDCGNWTYSTTNRVTVAPTQTGYALKIDALVDGATFEDVEFDVQRANVANAGESSIAVFVGGSANVAFHRVVMVAGNAADGAPGAGASPDGGASAGASNWFGAPPSYAELNGNDATDGGGGSQKICMCPDGTSSIGGQGGAGAVVGGQQPGAGMPTYGGDAGAGLPGRNSAPCGGGGSPVQNGGDAPAGIADTPSTSPGVISAGGWAPALGAPGSNGKPGQGGGGGGDGPAATGGGGGGACGGCGGAAGKPGAGGGSSIALLSHQSSVALVGCTLTAGNAGAGGAGGGGEEGQTGSLVAGVQRGSGCPGGAGGSGAGGNGGQGGPGGLSLGIGYSGSPPTFDGSPVAAGQTLARVTLGARAAGGSKGSGGPAASTSVGQPQAGADGSPGTAGVAQAVLGL